MANIARTASVASLNFWSAIVAAARIASTAYAPKATHNRFIPTTPPRAKAARVGGPVKTWCTGEDSNLRSSQGAADLQSAAINHSATCARFDRASCSQYLPESQVAGPGIASPCCQRTLRAKSIAPQSRRNSTPESQVAGPGIASPCCQRRLRAKSIAPQSRRNSTTATRPYFRARFAFQEAAAGISSSLGELRVSFGLLLLRLSGALMVTILELAKGFEPPTL